LSNDITDPAEQAKIKLSRYRHVDAKGERVCSLHSFLTSAVDRGEWLASWPGPALPPGKDPVPIGWEDRNPFIFAEDRKKDNFPQSRK
jgi:hypothetical protein